MDGKARESLIGVVVWFAVLVLPAFLLFRRPSRRTASNVATFVGFALLGACVAAIVAPVFASARAARAQTMRPPSVNASSEP